MKTESLKSLMESAVLNDETKQVLSEAWDTAIKAKEQELEVDYATKFSESLNDVKENTTAMVEEAVADEFSELADEVAEARSLEVQYARKLEDFKESYHTKLQEQTDEQVKSIVEEELNELKEDIDVAKKHQFALEVFESFRGMYDSTFGGENMNAQNELTEAKQELEDLKRKVLLNDLLESVTGDKRTVALTILEGVATNKLEAKFESIRPMLLAESEDTSQITESDKQQEDPTKGKRVVMENEKEDEDKKQVTESAQDDKVLSALQRSIKFARSK